MKEWPGIRDDQSQVGGDGLTEAVGISFSVEGELRRRAGLSFLYGAGYIALSSFRHAVTGAWIATVHYLGFLGALRLSTGVATSGPTVNIEKRPLIAPLGPRIYWTNDFDRMQVWDSISSMGDAGIAAPVAVIGAPSTAAGNCTVGVHLIRYRFIDSKSPTASYRSNPSTALTYTVASAAAGALTFDIGAVATDIIRSTDAKVDTISIEMTLVDGDVYYVATTCLNTATTVTVNVSDAALSQAEDVDALWGNFGHEQPPLGLCVFECRGHAFLCGASTRTRTVGVTNNSASVTGTNFSPLWIGRLIRFGTDAIAYEISAATTTTLTLTQVYAGSTNAAITSVVYSKNPNRAYWSRQYLPESWKASTQARDVLAGYGDAVVGGVDFQGDAWFFGSRSIARLVFTDDPANGEVNPVPGYHGLWNIRCLMPLDGVLYGWGANGAWMISGGAPRWISRPCDTSVRALMDVTQSDKFFAAYDPIEKVIRWHFVETGETIARRTLTYELTGQRWTLDQYRQGLDCATTYADDNGRIRLAVADATNGNLYYHEGATDGVTSTSTGAYTVAPAGSSGVDITVNESLPTGDGLWLWSMILYRPSTGEERVIYDNTTSTIEIDSAFATELTVGESIYVGAIPCSLLTDWWIGRDLSDKKRPHLHILLDPSATGSLRVKVYRDFQSTPHVWTANDADRWPDGVTLVTGRDYVEVALAGSATVTDGFVPLPMPSDWGRAWRAEVTCLSPAGTMKLLDVRFAVTAERDQGNESDE